MLGATNCLFLCTSYHIIFIFRPAGDENIKFQFHFAFADSSCFVSRNRQREVGRKLKEYTRREGSQRGRGLLRAFLLFRYLSGCLSVSLSQFSCNKFPCPSSQRDTIKEAQTLNIVNIVIIVESSDSFRMGKLFKTFTYSFA